jgi:hypothetical protein
MRLPYIAGLLTGIGLGAFAYWLVVITIISEPVPGLGWSPLVALFAVAGEMLRKVAVRRLGPAAPEPEAQ